MVHHGARVSVFEHILPGDSRVYTDASPGVESDRRSESTELFRFESVSSVKSVAKALDLAPSICVGLPLRSS